MDVQQLELKFFAAADAADFDQATLIPVFHRWIRENRLGDVLLIDVADYRHVPDGPGVMLIGHGVQWKLDSDRGEPGLVFARKRDEPGDAAGKLAEAYDCAVRAVDALEGEPALRGGLRFDRDHGQVTVMSRLAAANDAQTYDQLAPVVAALISARRDGATVTTERVSDDAREPLAVRFRVQTA